MSLYVYYAYLLPAFLGDWSPWNETLIHLYVANEPLANYSMGIHFTSGVLLIVLGPLLLSSQLRSSRPALHRLMGRTYLLLALTSSLYGLLFIALRGCVGGWPMSVGFSVFGLLTLLSLHKAGYYARTRQIALHRAWALRLFALGIAPLLYRTEYGLWALLNGGEVVGHVSTYFSGWFDYLMDFFFYLPNLLFVEWHLRRERVAIPLKLVGLAAFCLGTIAASLKWWLPAILGEG